MMASLAKIYGDADNFRTQKVLIATKLAKKQHQLVQGTPPLNVSPFGLVSLPCFILSSYHSIFSFQTPSLEDGKVTIFGADAISKYLLKDMPYYPKVCILYLCQFYQILFKESYS
jgi:hypothetical protein